MKGNKGFTLIELIIVIVILGILAAMIIPRFAALDQKARSSAVLAMKGSIYSAAAIVHSMAVVEGKTGTGDASESVSLEGHSVNLVWGYPAGNTGGIETALATTEGFTVASAGSAAGKATFTKTDAPKNGNDCFVEYTPPAAQNGAPTISAIDTCVGS